LVTETSWRSRSSREGWVTLKNPSAWYVPFFRLRYPCFAASPSNSRPVTLEMKRLPMLSGE